MRSATKATTNAHKTQNKRRCSEQRLLRGQHQPGAAGHELGGLVESHDRLFGEGLGDALAHDRAREQGVGADVGGLLGGDDPLGVEPGHEPAVAGFLWRRKRC